MLQILVVEDDPLLASTLRDALEEYCGASVTAALDGRAATDALGSIAFDLAVIDMGLPDVCGLELAEAAASRKVPALIITGHKERQKICEEHGFPLLAKPFSLRRFVDVASHALKGTDDDDAPCCNAALL